MDKFELANILKEIFKNLKEKLEDKFYILLNRKALSKKSYNEFLEIESICEEDIHK